MLIVEELMKVINNWPVRARRHEKFQGRILLRAPDSGILVEVEWVWPFVTVTIDGVSIPLPWRVRLALRKAALARLEGERLARVDKAQRTLTGESE